MKLLIGREIGKISRFAKFLSYPPAKTSHFNPDGQNIFWSKLQILVSFPSLVVFVSLILIFIGPLFYPYDVRSEIEVESFFNETLGTQLPSNHSQIQWLEENRPWYFQIYSTFYGSDFGIRRQSFPNFKFFSNVNLTILDDVGDPY